MFIGGRLSTLLITACAVAGSVIVGGALVAAQQGNHGVHTQHVAGSVQTVPTMPGQDAFGAIQEIVHILKADPNTNWERSIWLRCASIL